MMYEIFRTKENGVTAERNLPNPTPAELEILRVLWRIGPATVRDVQDAIPAARRSGYTTVLKLLQIMTEKGLVAREPQGRAHLYRAIPSESQARRQIVGDMLDRVFGGAAEQLVMHALTARKASPEELAEIRKLLDRLEGDDR
jgi:BlaI family transcriptional regulator, penicillinase repressor